MPVAWQAEHTSLNACSPVVGTLTAGAAPVGRSQRRQRRIVLARNGILREGRDVFLHLRQMQRVQQHVRPLGVGTDGARHREQHDGEGN